MPKSCVVQDRSVLSVTALTLEDPYKAKSRSSPAGSITFAPKGV